MRRTFLVSGHARLPKNVTAQHVYESVGVVLEIEPKHLVIVNVSATFITEEPRSFLRDLLVGYSLREGIEPLLKDVERYLHLPSQRAVLAALTDIWDRLPEIEQTVARGPKPEGGD